MRFSRPVLERLAAETGFQSEPLEKALHLLDLLRALCSHPYLSNRFVLKGGTALNLFLLDLPRLSVDVDLNYVGSLDREVMLAERPAVESAVHAVCARQGLSIARVPGEHAGGKWRLGFEREDGRVGRLELDVNYLLRVPLWPPTRRDSLSVGPVAAHAVPVLDEHELVAGKLAALFGRSASRDVFDAVLLLTGRPFDADRLRLAFVVYGAMSRRDWRTVSVDEVTMDPIDAERRLVPLLRSNGRPTRRDVASWCAHLSAQCRERLSMLLPLRPEETEFVASVIDRGEIVPELLTADPDLRQRIRSHPALEWRALQSRTRPPGA